MIGRSEEAVKTKDVPRTALLVEDDELEFRRYAAMLGKLGVKVAAASTVEEALRILDRETVDVLLTDIHLTPALGGEGLSLLAEVQKNHPKVLPIAMSSDPQLATADRAKALGAQAFLRKPLVNADELQIAFQTSIERRRTLDCLRERIEGPRGLPPQLAELCPDGMVVAAAHRRAAEIVARNREIAAVIYGETGTGKEEIAKLIHRRRVALEGPVPFVSVNCANLNSELADSILFGHVKGAFSGADRNTVGLVGEADGGILFLDEIHTLSLKTQYKLLRVMNDGSYSRLGSSVVQRSRFQALVASTRDLDEAVDRGEFLLDFRSRLIGIDFHLPPLRERQGEMELFVSLFFARQQIELAPSEFAAIVERCRRYYWRGNIRQLYKVLQAMVITAQCNDVPIRAADMPEFKTMLAPAGEERVPEPVPAASMTSPVVQGATHAREPEGLVLLRKALSDDVRLDAVLDAVEKTVIEASIQRHRLLQDSYRALGIGRNTFDVKRKKHGIVVDALKQSL